MGRSVSYPSGAIVAFSHQEPTYFCAECSIGGLESDTCEECGGEAQFDDEPQDDTDYYQDWIKEMFPSMQPCDEWLGREDHAIAENAFAYFGMSEYCGLVAFWLVAKEHETYYSDEARLPALGDRWLAQVEPRFRKAFGTLNKLGTFSNGEAVFERIGA